MNEIVEFLRGLIDPAQGYVLLAFAAGHIAIGVIGAMMLGEFDVTKFADFYKRVGLYFVAYVGAGIIGSVLTDWTAFQGVMFGALCAVYTARILEKLNEWGLPVPDVQPIVNGLFNGVGRVPGKFLKPKKRFPSTSGN